MTMETLRLSRPRTLGSADTGWRAWLLYTVVSLCACGGGTNDREMESSGSRHLPAQVHATLVQRDALAAVAQTAARVSRIAFVDRTLHVDVDRRPLHEVLAEIERQAAVSIIVAPSVSAGLISGTVNGASLVEGLLQLLHGYDLLLSFGATELSLPPLETVWVYPKGNGPRPQPAQSMVSSVMNAETIRDTAVPGEDAATTANDVARELLSLDPAVRYRALVHGLNLQLALPEHTLVQLAGADANRDTRLLALSAIARGAVENPAAARTAVQLALQDRDPAVREQAKDVQEQLDLAAMPNEGLPPPGTLEPMP